MTSSDLETEGAVAQFQPVWERKGWRKPNVNKLVDLIVEQKNWLIFSDESEQCEYFVSLLKKANQNVVVVKQGEKYERIRSGEYYLKAGQSDGYVVLFKELLNIQQPPSVIVHLWSRPQVQVTEENELNALDVTFYSLSFIAQAMDKLGLKQPIRLVAVSSNVHDVTGTEVTCPHKATLMGAIRVIRQEYPHVETQNIDVLPCEKNKQMMASQVLSELFVEPFTQCVVYRGSNRWTRSFSQVEHNDSVLNTKILEQDMAGWHWVITGGLGAVGLALAEYLSEKTHVKLTLLSRSPLPHHSGWQKALNEGVLPAKQKKIIRKLLALQEQGAEVCVHAVDVSDKDTMRDIIVKATDKFGPIQGVLHCAGIPGSGALHSKTKEQLGAVLLPKVSGTRTLSEVLAGEPLEFVGLMSSVTSYLGGFGQLEYCAANAFLDACGSSELFSNANQKLTINWDPWHEEGMAVEALTPSYNGHQGHLLLGECFANTESKCEFRSQLSAEECWVMSEHKILGKATLPGAAYLEMAQAAIKQFKIGSVVLKEVYFLTPLALTKSQWSELVTEVSVSDNKVQFEVSSRLNGIGKKVVNARGLAELQQKAIIPSAVSIDELIQRCSANVIEDTKLQSRDLKTFVAIQTGPHWDMFDRLYFCASESLARLCLDEAFELELDELALHPALVDCATAFMSGVVQDAVFIPIYYQRLQQYRPFTRECYSHVKLVSGNTSKDTLRFDVAILDLQGNRIVDVEGFEMKRVTEHAIELDKKTEQLPTVEIKGLSTEEAIDHFSQVFTRSERNVVISTMDFNHEVRRYQEYENLLEEATSSTLKQIRPELDVAFVAAKSSKEKKISEIWQTILSIEEVGVLDDFFELGGDSLMLMQVHSKLSAEFPDNDLPIADLYNYSTIKSLVGSLENGQENYEKEQEKVEQRVAKMKKARRKRNRNHRVAMK